MIQHAGRSTQHAVFPCSDIEQVDGNKTECRTHPSTGSGQGTQNAEEGQKLFNAEDAKDAEER